MALNIVTNGVAGQTLAAGDTLSLGETYTFTMTTNQNGFVNPTGGVPYILLNNGGHAVYTAGSGSKTLTFSYTVGAQPNETGVTDLSTAAANAFQFNGGTVTDSASPGGGALGQLVKANGQSASGTQTVDAICFYPGTRVRTPAGDTAVEALQLGDLVITTEGKAAPIRWMGRQTVATRFADPLTVLPIRIRAGALAELLPERDLLVSPGHAILLHGVLVHAGALVNGSSILREAAVPDVFTYHHVELADHALILAEGVPAETYVDNVERIGFDNWAEHEALYGADVAVPEMDLPRAKSHRQVPMAVREQIAARATLLFGAASIAA